MKNLSKSFLALAAFLAFAHLGKAQTVNSGAWMLGGSAGLDISKYKEANESSTTILVFPTAGYFIADNLAVGLEAGLVSSSFDGESSTNFSVGPFVRYYVGSPVFIQANALFDLSEGGGTTFGGSVGYTHFLNNGLAIEPALYFQSYNAEGDFGDYTSFGLSIGFQGFLGKN